MLDRGYDISLSGIIGPQLVRDDHARRAALPFQELSHQPLCSRVVAAALHQNIENETVLIDGTPWPMFPSTNDDNSFVEVPLIAEPASGAAADSVGKAPTEFLRPRSNGLVRNGDPASSQHVFHHA